ncbi:MAG: cytidylate kinase family protein [Nanoarchaeota archaeon]
MRYTVIAIAGLPGSGKTTLANSLKELSLLRKWKFISTGMLLRERHADLVKANRFSGQFLSYLGNLSDDEIRVLNNNACSVAQEGHLILDSRFAVENCKNLNNALLIFVTAPLAVRVERQRRAHPEKSYEEIQRDLEQREKWEVERAQRIYGYDHRNTKHYKIILDTAQLTPGQEVEAIIKQLECPQNEHSPLVIAISGLPGSGSTTTARLLAKKLNLEYLSPGRIFKDLGRGIAKDQPYYPVFAELCASRNIAIPNYTASNDSQATVNLWETSFGKNPVTHEIIDEVQRRHAQKGNVVIDGKLSLHMLPQARPKIWLTGDLDTRVQRVAQRDSISPEAARELLTKRESQEAENWKKMYGFDYREQKKDATLVIDTSNLSPEQVADKIFSSIHNNL